MLGLESLTIFMAYLLCIISSGLCVLYGILNWNSDQ